MNMVDIIIKKRNGGKLTKEEIEWFIEAYTNGDVPDYQASALLMAIYYQHLDEEETFVLTKARPWIFLRFPALKWTSIAPAASATRRRSS